MENNLLKQGTYWRRSLGVFTFLFLAIFYNSDVFGQATYCNSNFTDVTYEHITNVTFGGINNTSGGTTGGPVNYLSQTANVIAGVPSLISVTIQADQQEYVYAFIDWNQNGTLNDVGEVYTLASNVSSNGPFTMIITPPVSASGSTRMRVMVDYASSGPNPCLSSTYGEAEDYTVNVAAAPPCSGTPSAGTAYGPASVCATQVFTLMDTASSAAAGLTYQWEESPANAGVWTPISGATNLFYTVSAGITTATDYHLVVTCTNGGGTTTSNIVSVAMNPFYSCYCSPLIGTTLSSYPGSNFITKVEIPGTTLNNTTSTAGNGGFTPYSSSVANQTTTLIPGLTYGLNVDMQYSYDYDYSAAWIDFDGDGTFGSSEYITLTSNNATGSSGLFIAPVNATPGLTGLRVRVNDYGNTYSATDACIDDGAGETEDYVVTIATLSPCGGTPVAGITYGPDSVCAGIPFNMMDTAFTIAAGLTFQWESSPTGAGVWTPIAGATNTLYTETAGITAPTDYHLIVTCTNGGGTDVSSSFTVNLNPFYKCYCSPLTATTLSNYPGTNFITKVEVPGTTLNNSTSSTNGNGYTLFSTAVPTQTATLIPGLTYTLNVDMQYSYDFNYSAAWVDFDGDGSFGSSEYITLTSNNTTGSSGIFIAPVNATPGLTGLRVRVNDYGNTYGATDACMNDGAGETEDYLVTIATLSPCSGMPVGGTAYGPDSVCAGISFNMMDTAFTIAAGLTFQWESSPAGAGVWTPIAGATNSLYTESSGITSPTDYHMIVTCTNGGGTDVSNTFTVNLNPFYKCYCSPLTATTLSNYPGTNFITKVEVPGTTLNNSTSSTNGNGYTLYAGTVPSQTATLIPGLTYSINVDMQYSYDYSAAWVDFDGDGSFGSSEYITLASNNTTGSSGIFIAPITATPGLTGLRVRVNDYGNTYGATDACMNDGAGETEDYLVTIATLSPCSGMPVGGTAYGPDSVCAGIPFNLMDTAFTIAAGLTFQWESSPAGAGVWTPIAGATNSLYTESSGITSPTDYHMVVTCTNGGGTDVSNTFTVGINPFYKCYCSPLTGNALSSSYTDNFITGVDIPGTTLSNSSSSANPNGYTMYSATVPSQTAILIPGLSYTLNVAMMYPQYDDAGAWGDFDGDGNFGSSEFIALSNNGTTGASGTFITPVTATPGLTGLRVRVNDWGNVYSASDACMDDGAGETEDYLVTVAALAACTGTPTAGTAYGPDSVCAGVPVTLTDTAFTLGQGITYQWEESPYGANTWTALSGATTPSYVITGGISAATEYRLVVTCTNGSAMDTSNVISISGIYPASQCYCIPVGSSGGYGVQSFSTTGGYSNISNLNSGLSAGGYGNFTNMTLSASPSGVINFTTSFISGTNGFAIWVDWGQDGSFAQPGDLVYNTTSYQGSPLTGSFTVPATATPGNTRMRIIGNWDNNNPSTEYCSSAYPNYAEWEDYTFTVAPPPTCPPPTGLAATNTTATSTILNWTENGTATQWSIEYGPTGFTPGSGTYVSAPTNPYTLTGLAAGTAYDIYVKSICSATDSSFSNGPVNINTAQIPVASYPYAINWDNGGGGWTYANGSQPNKWFVGAPGANNGTGGLFVSNDGGVTNGYNNGSSSTVHAYRDLDLTSFSASVPLTFNSYIVGEASVPYIYDYLSVWIVPISYAPVPGTDISTVAGAIPIDSIFLETGWTQHLLNIPASATGTTSRLVLQWKNDGSSGSAPVKVDNLTIGGFPLVIKLRDIDATNLGAKNRVDWSTESELKSDKFELERSADGRNFTYLATIKAKGEASNYSYMDLSPVTGVNYYRLKMIDAAGAVATSKVVTATVKQGVFTVEAYPNPVSENLTIQVYGGSDQNATVAITDVTGKVMKVVSVVNGNAEVNMNGLASGVYLVKYTDNNHSQTIKVNKQ